MLGDLFECDLDAQCSAVRPIGGHRFDNVGDGEDLGLRQYLVTLEPAGIPRTIEALVVLVGDLCHRPGIVDRRQRCEARTRMSLDHLPLEVVESAGLHEDLRGDVDLADVVKHAGKPQAVDPVL
jgi:hypothetical protein